MSPAEAATSLGRAVGTLRRGSAGHHARPVVLAAAGIGLAAVWATARRGPRDARAQVGLEEALRTHARELARFAARLTDVADAERRRIERDLHDGCQQRLICLRMKLALAERLVGDENDSAAKLIHEITDGAESALEDLEALVHGMYFACAEALQNAAKHAGGTATARIALRHGGSGLAFEVHDDGSGFADAAAGGSGLANMQDRLSSIAGQLRITSAPGCGTTVQGWVGGVEPLGSAVNGQRNGSFRRPGG